MWLCSVSLNDTNIPAQQGDPKNCAWGNEKKIDCSQITKLNTINISFVSVENFLFTPIRFLPLTRQFSALIMLTRHNAVYACAYFSTLINILLTVLNPKHGSLDKIKYLPGISPICSGRSKLNSHKI